MKSSLFFLCYELYTVFIASATDQWQLCHFVSSCGLIHLRDSIWLYYTKHWSGIEKVGFIASIAKGVSIMFLYPGSLSPHL